MTIDIWAISTIKVSAGITALVVGFTLLFPRFGGRVFERAEQVLSRFAKKKSLALAGVFLSAIAIRLLVLPLLPVPIPGVHDEFSYLLAGDTFTHGRLTNPPHPMWVSFETMHVNWLPTYASKYPAAQGLLLALGQLLGHPWIGVLLSNAAMCAAILWMLQAWLPARWAFLGALLSFRPAVTSYWINGYWGGAAAAIGGALVIGALARIVKQTRIRDAGLLGLGITILANSRPFEGLIFCLPIAVWFVYWWLSGAGSKASFRERTLKVVVPLLCILALTGAFVGYYNWRVTGDPLLLPYAVNNRMYSNMATFLWDRPGPPLRYRNPQIEDFWLEASRYYNHQWRDVVKITLGKINNFARTFLWTGSLLLIVAAPYLFRDRRMRFLLIALAGGGAGWFAVAGEFSHYAAPITGVIYALIVQAIRHLRLMHCSPRPLGTALSRAVVVLLVLDLAVSVTRAAYGTPGTPIYTNQERPGLIAKLQHTPGKHLVMVRYKRNHFVHDEWVYNGAEIDSAKVLWARELDPEQNSKLFAYFSDRRIWLVTPDLANHDLQPYAPLVSASTAAH
jgi:hypothetical protein